MIEAETQFKQALAMREESAEAPPSSVAESLVDVAKAMLASVSTMTTRWYREKSPPTCTAEAKQRVPPFSHGMWQKCSID